jgi:hypothetical protein
MYGGIDIIEQKIYRDAFIFKNHNWSKLNINGNPSERIRSGIAVC